MLNRVTLEGNIGLAPRISLTRDGGEMATFSLATSVRWKDGTGEWQSVTDWHCVIVFRESTIGWIKDILNRGDTVYVEGKLTYQQWTDTYGQARFTPRVVISAREGRIEVRRSRTQEQNVDSKNPESEEQHLKEEASLPLPSADLDDIFLNPPCRSLDPANAH